MRHLGRTEIEIPPIIWRIDEKFDRQMLDAAGGEWVYAPAGSYRAELHGLKVLLGVEADALRPRSNAAVEYRLKELMLTHCTAIVLQGASADDVKTGWPFHRLIPLREQNLAQLVIVETLDALEAEWLVENSPAHGILVPFGQRNMSAAFRLLDAAKEVGTAILATPPALGRENATDLQLRLSDDRIAAAVEPLPQTNAELMRIREALNSPLSDEVRAELWNDYSSRIPPPPPLRSGHPPEYGA
ncbi:MAG TPA: hypothetical protein VMD30_11215 [Tepidisphaeraceae bacterium]|nr:hypothetical protein [Tepidisphaeraceae bacterium]